MGNHDIKNLQGKKKKKELRGTPFNALFSALTRQKDQTKQLNLKLKILNHTWKYKSSFTNDMR